jgi:hypothetical protein
MNVPFSQRVHQIQGELLRNLFDLASVSLILLVCNCSSRVGGEVNIQIVYHIW